MQKKMLTEKTLSPSCFIGINDPDIISFGSGQPDLPPPENVYSCLPTYQDFKYGTIVGDKRLREALAKQYPESTSEDFIITNGASEALDLTLRSIQSIPMPGKKDKVLMMRPYYYSYPYLAKFAGLKPVYTESVKGKIDFNDFKKQVVDCKAVLINSPSNPTGRVEEIETLKKIENLAEELGFYVISDEVYKELIYERENYLIKGSRVVTVNSFSKTYAMCGFRVGYLWSRDAQVVKRITEMKTHTSMNTNILGQEMALSATKTPREEIEKQVEIWKERRDLTYNGLKALALELWRPEGAFYVLPKI